MNDKGEVNIKAGGINFTKHKADIIDKEIEENELNVDFNTRREMINQYQIPYEEVNIISSEWEVQRAYRVKGGTIIEFQKKEISIPKKYVDIYNRNVKIKET